MHSVATVRKVPGPQWVNDTHSALNHTAVSRIAEPQWVGDVAETVARARRLGEPLAISGARHAMGGQQFLAGGTLLDMRRLNHVRWFDRGEALMEVEAGITWPDVIRGYLALQRGPGPSFGIRSRLGMNYADPHVAVVQHAGRVERRNVFAAQDAQQMSKLTQIRRMAGKPI